MIFETNRFFLKKLKKTKLFLNRTLLKETIINKKSKIFLISTKSRSSVIYPCFLNYKMFIYNGMKFVSLKILDVYLGHKLGEFVLTRKFPIHKKKGKHIIKKKKKIIKKQLYLRNLFVKNINFLKKKNKFLNI